MKSHSCKLNPGSGEAHDATPDADANFVLFFGVRSSRVELLNPTMTLLPLAELAA